MGKPNQQNRRSRPPEEPQQPFPHEDVEITCVDCGQQFVFTLGEQEFYERKGLKNWPKRCTNCRSKKKESKAHKKSGRSDSSAEPQ